MDIFILAVQGHSITSHTTNLQGLTICSIYLSWSKKSGETVQEGMILTI
jgi:hypothetical protein